MRVIAYALAAALDRLAKVLDGDTAEAGVHFTCDEADAIADVLAHSGHSKVAAYWLAMHGADDEDPDPAEGAGDRHRHLHQLVDEEFDINWDAARRYVANTFSVASDPAPLPQAVTTGEGHVFEPWTDGHAVGFKVTHTGGRVEFIYLSPSSVEDDGMPNLSVYVGPDGDSATDPTACFLDLFGGAAVVGQLGTVRIRQGGVGWI